MLALKIPKSILWAAFVTLFFLVLMTAYRLITQPIFSAEAAQASLGRVYWLGLRFDLRWVAIVVLPMVLMGMLPGLHLFKSQSGKTISVVVFTLFAAAIFIFYGIDLAHQISFNQRLTTGLADELRRNTEGAKAFKANAPWLIIALVAGVGTWLSYLTIRRSHHWIGTMKSADNPALRSFWQFLFVLIMGASIYGRISSVPLGQANLKGLKNDASVQAALNPFESLRQLPLNKK